MKLKNERKLMNNLKVRKLKTFENSLQSFGEKRSKILSDRISMLEQGEIGEAGFNFNTKLIKSCRELRELKVSQFRLFYFRNGDEIVFTDIFFKTGNRKDQNRAIKRAEYFMYLYLENTNTKTVY